MHVPDGHRARTIVTINGSEIPVMLVELLRREPRELTEYEKQMDAGRDRPRRYPVYHYFPNGKLSLSLEWPTSAGRLSWREGKRFFLESLLGRFISGLEDVAATKKRIDECWAKAEERTREEEQRRAAREESRRAEQRRVDELIADVEAWSLSQKIYAYVNALEAKLNPALRSIGKKIHAESKAGKWISWARGQADRLDPLSVSPLSVLDEEVFGRVMEGAKEKAGQG